MDSITATIQPHCPKERYTAEQRPKSESSGLGAFELKMLHQNTLFLGPSQLNWVDDGLREASCCPPLLEKQASRYTGSGPAAAAGAETCSLNCPLGSEEAAAVTHAVLRGTLDYHAVAAHTERHFWASCSFQVTCIQKEQQGNLQSGSNNDVNCCNKTTTPS